MRPGPTCTSPIKRRVLNNRLLEQRRIQAVARIESIKSIGMKIYHGIVPCRLRQPTYVEFARVKLPAVAGSEPLVP